MVKFAKRLLRHPHRSSAGFTMIEIICVIIILGILATVATQALDSSVSTARNQEAQAEMDRLARAIVGTSDATTPGARADFGYVGDNGALPTSLTNLTTNPGGWSTWKGPYVRGNFTENTNDFSTDPWGTAYTYSGGVTIVSSGSGSTITKQFANTTAQLLSTTVQGVILDRNGTPPGSEKSNVAVTITYPNGSGSLTSQSVNPNSSGSFTFSNIPIGNQAIRAVYSTAADTVNSYVGVYPRAGGYAGTLRFGTDHWVDGGGGGGGTGVVSYVAGTGLITSARKNVDFDITNTGTADVAITWMKISWSAASVFSEEVKIGTSTYFSSNCNKMSSGDTVTVSPAFTLAVGAQASVHVNKYKTTICGNANASIADNTSYTVVFSNGNSITFTVIQ